MSGNYVYPPAIWPPAVTLLFLASLAVYSWRRRSVPGALPFALACWFTVVAQGALILQNLADGAAAQLFWYKIGASAHLPAISAVTCFILEYTWPGRWLTRRNLILLSIAPIAFIGLAATSDFHHLILDNFVAAGDIGADVQTPIGTAFLMYGNGLGILNLVVFAWLFSHSPQHRWPVVIMGLGQVIARTLFNLQVYDILPGDPSLDVLPTALVFIMYTITLFGFRMFNPIPLAHQVAVEQLHAGLVVLDPQERVLSLNQAAERMMNLAPGGGQGRLLRDLLPVSPPDLDSVADGEQVELGWGTGSDAHCYAVGVSRLRDWRGLEIGRLLILHDVTRQKHTQAQLLEQERALVQLQEREHLARELHDGAGQVLGYVSMQAQAIARWVQDGKLDLAEAQLARLVRVAQDAHADLRVSILNLRSGAAAGGFLAALKQHLVICWENYGFCPELSLSGGIDEDDFSPEVGEQLLRVIQEALTNARKHAQAGQVRVRLAREDGQITITVSDDGLGFDPDAILPGGAGHFGLIFMRERMARIGGRLDLRSGAGSGTEIKLWVPAGGQERR